MCEDLDETLFGKIVIAKLVDRIPTWFGDKQDSDLLIKAIENEELDDTLEEIIGSMKIKLRSIIEVQVAHEFNPGKIRSAALKMLRMELSMLGKDRRFRYKTALESLKRAKYSVTVLEKEIKKMTSGEVKRLRNKKE